MNVPLEGRLGKFQNRSGVLLRCDLVKAGEPENFLWHISGSWIQGSFKRLSMSERAVQRISISAAPRAPRPHRTLYPNRKRISPVLSPAV